MRVLLVLSVIASSATAYAVKRPPCATVYSVVEHDALGNVRQGAARKDLKKLQVDLQKKYPDVCYAEPAPNITTVLYVSIERATYHGTRTVTNTANTTGQASSSSGETATYNGTTTSSQEVPESFDYGRYILTVETVDGEKVTARHRFHQDGIYHTMYGIPLGGRGHHPESALIEDAVKWIHEGGLEDPLQSNN